MQSLGIQDLSLALEFREAATAKPRNKVDGRTLRSFFGPRLAGIWGHFWTQKYLTGKEVRQKHGNFSFQLLRARNWVLPMSTRQHVSDWLLLSQRLQTQEPDWRGSSSASAMIPSCVDFRQVVLPLWDCCFNCQMRLIIQPTSQGCGKNVSLPVKNCN